MSAEYILCGEFPGAKVGGKTDELGHEYARKLSEVLAKIRCEHSLAKAVVPDAYKPNDSHRVALYLAQGHEPLALYVGLGPTENTRPAAYLKQSPSLFRNKNDHSLWLVGFEQKPCSNPHYSEWQKLLCAALVLVVHLKAQLYSRLCGSPLTVFITAEMKDESLVELGGFTCRTEKEAAGSKTAWGLKKCPAPLYPGVPARYQRKLDTSFVEAAKRMLWKCLRDLDSENMEICQNCGKNARPAWQSLWEEFTSFERKRGLTEIRTGNLGAPKNL